MATVFLLKCPSLIAHPREKMTKAHQWMCPVLWKPSVLLWELEDGLVPALQQGNTPYVHGVLYLYQDLASTQKALELLGKRYGRLQPYVEEEYLQDKKS
ncbi:ral guanine nucleotide dissociation stimulator-like isoform X1 [Marmota flaviventris]|uniref:ral guanine nucleotide dissociation stimulator-like isoform X1 n=2 Tax=Marmota flaviventris TaxID=93162 RepID=UPI003A880167